MASETTNLHLIKPGYNDAADIKDINDNMDILDNAHAEVLDAIDAKEDNLTKGTIVGTDSDVKDLDEYMTTGLYYVTVNAYLNNAPVEPTAYGWLEVLKMNTGAILQRFTQYGGDSSTFAGNTYVRYYINSQWYAWVLTGGGIGDNVGNMLWGGDDLRNRISDSAVQSDTSLFPYPMKYVSSTFSLGSCVGMSKKGIGWNSSVVAGETGKYTTIDLCEVPNNFPITVSFQAKAGSYYRDTVRAKITSNSGTYPVNDAGGNANCGCIVVTGNDSNMRKLQWRVGKAATMGGADYDARLLYNLSDCNILSIRVEYGVHEYDRYDMVALSSYKEKDFEAYMKQTMSEEAASSLNKGEVENNFNVFTKTGLYYARNISSSELPYGYGYLEVWEMGDNVLQRFTIIDNDHVDMQDATYVRHLITGLGWSDWKLLNFRYGQNLLLGGDDLTSRFSDSSVRSIMTPFTIESSTYGSGIFSIAFDNYGALWNVGNSHIVSDRDKYTRYKFGISINNNLYPITVTFLIKISSSDAYDVASATILQENTNYVVHKKNGNYVGCVRLKYNDIEWSVGRATQANSEEYDAYGLYNLGNEARIVAIRVEFGDRVYSITEMNTMRNKVQADLLKYTDEQIEGVYDTVCTYRQYASLNTTDKTIVGAINEILARLQ